MKLHQRLDHESASWWEIDPRPVDRLLAHYTPYAERLSDKRAAKQRLVDPEEYRQEALIALWEAIQSFEPGQCAFTTWAMWRIRGGLIEAERANDWVKPKVRSAANAGELDLPAMLRIKETFDVAVDEQEPDALSEMMAVLLAKSKPWVVNIIGTYLDSDCDEDKAAAVLNVKAEYFGQVLLPKAIEELRGIPCNL